MQSAEGIAGGAHLVGGSRGLQQHLFVQRTKGVQALEMLRTIEQRTCVVFCLEVSVSHCGHCSDGGEVGETLPPGSAIGSTRKRVRGCHPSVLGPVRRQSAVRFSLPLTPSDPSLAVLPFSVPVSPGSRADSGHCSRGACAAAGLSTWCHHSR